MMKKSIYSNFFQFKKVYFSVFYLVLLLSCSEQAEKKVFRKEVNTQKTSIKGKVFDWPTDTVYFATFTFHSPYATSEGFQILTPDKNFEYIFDKVDKPFIVFLTPERKFLDLRKDVLFENLTDKYYRGYCQKFYDYPITTYLIEPGTETKVELKKTKRYGKTLIKFLNTNTYNSAYYQTTFVLDQELDEVLDSRSDMALKDIKNIDLAIKNLNNKWKELLADLDQEQQYISPFLYRYTKAEIEFGARKEFLRYFLLDHRRETVKMFTNIPEKINKVIEFNKQNVDYATTISQEYNEFLELYLTFKFSKLKGKLITYKEFDQEKFEFALKELPNVSKYDYLANNILHSNNNNVVNKELIATLIKLYPDGELNDKLLKKYKSFV